VMPDWEAVEKELRGRGVTLRLSNPFLAHRRGLSFRNLSVEVVRRDAALKTLCIVALFIINNGTALFFAWTGVACLFPYELSQ
jgi:hypothetical protein